MRILIAPDKFKGSLSAAAVAAHLRAGIEPRGGHVGIPDGLDLLHAVAPADDVERGEAFMARLTDFCRTMSGRTIERDALIPDEYLKGLAELGVFGMKIPRDYGGLGLSLVYYGRALALLGSVHPSLGALLSAHQSIGVPEPVKVFGTPAQKQEYLPRCAAGAITAFLLTEPDVGSDPARMGEEAEAVPGLESLVRSHPLHEGFRVQLMTALYRLGRHPIMLGIFIILWAAPRMTFDHLVLSLGMSVYILLALHFEERDLIDEHGQAYREYQRTVPRLLPTLGPAGMRSDWLMTLALRWMGNLVTDEDRDRAARVWRWAGRRSLARDHRPPFA